jgi:hypothetical protein
MLLCAVSVLAFFIWFSPTLWPHNAVSLLLPCAWFAGQGWFTLQIFLGRTKSVLLFVTLALACVSAVLAVRDQWSREWYFGLRQISRSEIATVAETVREHTAPDEKIIAPAAICVEAKRQNLIHYRELEGLLRGLHKAREAGAVKEFLKSAGQADFHEIRRVAARALGPELDSAVRHGHAAAVVRGTVGFDFVDARVSLAGLQEYGYEEVLSTDHYTVWLAPSRSRTAPAR